MVDQNKLEPAKRTFETLCQALDSRQWKYRRNDEELSVEYIVNGEDMPMRFFFVINAEYSLVRLLSPMPLTVKESKRLDVAVAVSMINNRLLYGSFNFDVTDGELRFRLCNSFRDSVLGTDVFLHMIAVGNIVVERYNDKLFMLATGVISLEKFIELFNEETK